MSRTKNKNVSADILDELRNNYPFVECLKAENPELLAWCINFFRGIEEKTWSDDLQTMIVGFQIETTHVSESQLLSELLQEGICPHELAKYKNDVLIPFGHLAPGAKYKDEDSLNFTTLLSQIRLPLFAGITPKERLEIEPLLDPSSRISSPKRTASVFTF